ncbi:hypothetical protein [Streptomyces sp. NPDC005760]|uniref:hypothetical protein n=1 Tax=Streptomyces sp. NPDC005760 TaxID=3156718 RepID=UPI0033C56D62
MSRLSRDKKRDQQRGAAPIDVRVPLTGESATVAGTPVTAPPGEELHRTVLTHLHHLALAGGRPVHATIHDARIGYVVPLEVTTDGSSRFTAEPVRMAPPEGAGAPAPEVTPSGEGERPMPSGASEASTEKPWPSPPAAPQPTDAEAPPTQVLRQLPDSRPTGPAPVQAPGTVVPPTGAFGPPPVMDTSPPAGQASPMDFAYTGSPVPQPAPAPAPEAPPEDAVPTPPPPPAPTPDPKPLPSAGVRLAPQPLPTASPTPRPAAAAPLIDPVPLLDDPGPKPVPVRGFDAVAEAVMGEGLVVDETAVLAEPVGRISEAVREGRTDVAAELAERVVDEASGTLGAEHPDVLRVRELAAYIAYLGGEPVQAAEISLDLAGIHHRAGDAESAYGNVQSAATAWKAVRDPLRGLALGRELLTLWTELAAGQGPAAEEPDRLESARSRMLRLAERARNADQ